MERVKYTHRRKLFLKNSEHGLRQIGEARILDITITHEFNEKMKLLKMSIPYKKPKRHLHPDQVVDIEDRSIEIKKA